MSVPTTSTSRRSLGVKTLQMYEKNFKEKNRCAKTIRDYKRKAVPLAGTIFPTKWYYWFRLVELLVPTSETTWNCLIHILMQAEKTSIPWNL